MVYRIAYRDGKVWEEHIIKTIATTQHLNYIQAGWDATAVCTILPRLLLSTTKIRCAVRLSRTYRVHFQFITELKYLNHN